MLLGSLPIVQNCINQPIARHSPQALCAISLSPSHRNEDLGLYKSDLHPPLSHIAHQTCISGTLAELHNPHPKDGSSPSDGRNRQQIDTYQDLSARNLSAEVHKSRMLAQDRSKKPVLIRCRDCCLVQSLRRFCGLYSGEILRGMSRCDSLN